MLALLDNTVLSNFAIIRRPELISASLGETAATTSQVADELNTGIHTGRLPAADWSWLPILTLSPSQADLYKTLLEHLNRGEASCLAYAFGAPDVWVFTDDRDAREFAGQMRISISGTLGLLLRLTRQQILALSGANAILREMIAAGYRSPIRDLRQLQ